MLDGFNTGMRLKTELAVVETTDPSTATLARFAKQSTGFEADNGLLARIELKLPHGNHFEMAMETPTLTNTF